MPTPPATVDELRARLSTLSLADEHRIGRRLEGLRRLRDRAKCDEALRRLGADVDAGELRMAHRAAGQLLLAYPDELPISQAHDELIAALRDHQVVVVAGETGSGKTTQLPKMLLELGRGRRAMVGHTQPRRIAARSAAERLAEEMRTEVGATVGYAVRFTDEVGDDTMVKLMTDGLLVAEIQRDPLLLGYDAIVVDEAHERSLTIDFLLGYLKRLLPRRRDLQVVVTSATIDPGRFAAHFDGAPVLEVSGRTYPVEVRYRPVDDPDADPVQALCEAVDELAGEGPGDVLVFLSGEREIRDAADALREHTQGQRRPPEILPLYGRLSAGEQHQVFTAHSGRRVVLATNVAETSLTVPGIGYVVDTGTARISRFSQRLKVQRLPIEPISQASADQRSGRCGRTSDGIAIRLYSKDDFDGRPEFTEPEILRTNLASVVLQMAALGLGELGDFPFVDPPDSRAVRDGVQLLAELAALDPRPGTAGDRLTDLGRRLARLPLDPRLGRMVLEADRLGCVREVVVIAAALSIQDPRERPADKQAQADQAHARFRDPTSDLMGHLRLWQHLRTEQQARSSSGFRRMCRQEFLHYLRVREWQDMVAQLRRVLGDIGVAMSGTPDDPDLVHRALLSGLLSHVGLRQQESRDYLGARNARFAIFPGSALFRSRPEWVMAGELVETSRLWGRDVARIDPDWVEPLAEHLVKRTYAEPHWERDRGSAVALETVTLYGIPIVSGRRVQLGRVDPALARELFIRHALVEGDWETRARFFHANRELLADVEDLEHRTRRRDIVVDEQTLVDFYDRRVPDDVVSARHFESWWEQQQRRDPELLIFDRGLLVRDQADVDATSWSSAYPDQWQVGEAALPLSYVFDPGDVRDGVTVDVPLRLLHHLRAEDFAWQVPGLRQDLVTELIRSLPKPIRRRLVPAPDHAARVLPVLEPGARGLLPALAHQLLSTAGVQVSPADFDLRRLPEHLRLTFRVVDDDGREVAAGKELPALQVALRERLRATLTDAAGDLEQTGLRGWTIDELPRTVSSTRAGHTVTGYPALHDDGDRVSVRVLESEPAQDQVMRAGTVRLLRLSMPSPLAPVLRGLDNRAKLALGHNPYPSVPALLEDAADCAVEHLVAAAGGPAWDATAFGALCDRVRADLVPATEQMVAQVQRVLTEAHEARARLDTLGASSVAAVRDDVEEQLDELVAPGFVSRTGWDRLPDVVRYLTGVRQRLDRLGDDPRRDLARLDEILGVVAAYERARDAVPAGAPMPAGLEEARWLIEELRLGLFAPGVRTARPASVQRVRRALAAV